MAQDLQAEALRRFPSWSDAQRARWIAAREHSATLLPKWCRMVPMTMDQVVPRTDQFVARSLREIS